MKLSKALRPLKGELRVPGDKSISHRAVMLGSLAEGTTEITHFLEGADCLSTIGCFRRMGIRIDKDPRRILVHGKGLHGLAEPSGILDCGNSGTTARLISGILAGQTFASELTGDASIQKRPMGRIIRPLRAMGASIESIAGNDCAPLRIEGRPLRGHSLQFTGGFRSGKVLRTAGRIVRRWLYLGHGTRALPESYRINAPLFWRKCCQFRPYSRRAAGTQAQGRTDRRPRRHFLRRLFSGRGPADSGSEVLLRHVGINPTRDGILRVIRSMGGQVDILDKTVSGGEPAADLLVRSCPLHGTVIEGDLIPTLIDELPVLAVLAAFAEGTTTIRNAEELRVKESDRLSILAESLSAMGADVTETEDGLIIRGGKPLRGAVIHSHLDHRIAMSFAVAALAAEGETEITEADCVKISYPNFFEDLNSLTR